MTGTSSTLLGTEGLLSLAGITGGGTCEEDALQEDGES